MQRYKKILITGANGLLGTNTVKHLESCGIEVRAIVRNSNAVLQSATNCEIVYGDVMNIEDMTRAATGCDAIIHICSITDQSLLRYEHYRLFNVGALQIAIEAARRCKIARMVYVSSINTIGSGSVEAPGSESTPQNRIYQKQYYARSKAEAEKVLLEADDIDSVIVNPGFMIGPYDSKPSSGEIILLGYNKRVVVVSTGGKNFVDVRVVAQGLCNALQYGVKGKRYILGGVNLSIKEFYRMLGEVDGKKKVIVAFPCYLLIALGYCGNALRRLGVRTSISSLNMRAICIKEHYCSKKAESDLGLKETNLQDSIVSAVEWFKSEGMISTSGTRTT